MKVSGINSINPCTHVVDNSRGKSPSFKSEFVVDASTAVSRQQLLTLGMLTSNFWIYRPIETFERMRYNTYGQIKIQVKDSKDNVFAEILNKNYIKFTKTDDNTNSSTY